MPGRKQATRLAILATAATLAYLGFSVAQVVKPLDETGIVALIKRQFGDKGLVAKLKKDGVNFTVDDASVERLKKAGASDAVLEAVREVGKRSSSALPAAPAAIKAVTYDDVMQFLQLGIAEPDILERLEKSPIIFTLGADQIEALKKAGASEKLLEAMQGKSPANDPTKEITDFVIILDCSSSMAEKTKEGPSKMTVAKQVVTKLIQDIPDGLNLAFIIYGQDKRQGCKAVKVVRPMSPLDAKAKGELAQTIGRLQPVGYTPIALSLEVAGQELGRKDAQGGLVLISDGKDTCEGDPAAAAAKLARSPNLSLGVNVIGFDVRNDERKAVEEIARAGKGKYYNAQTAAQFREVVAEIHRRLPPPPPGPKTEMVQTKQVKPKPAPQKVLKPVDLKDDNKEGAEGVVAVRFTPDGKTLAWTYFRSHSCLWDLSQGEKGADLDHPGGWCNAISPDEKIFVAGSQWAVHFFAMATGEVLRTKRASWAGDNPVCSLAFSPDGKLLVSATKNTCLILWDISLRDEKLVLKDKNTEAVRRIVFSPDGKTLATGSSDGTVRLYDVLDWKVRSTFRARADKEYSIQSLAFSPDGKTLAEGNDEATVRMWDVATEKVRMTLEGHQAPVLSVAISPDGRFLAAGSMDSTAILWDLSQGKRLTTLKGHTGWVYCVGFAPDGRTLATGGRDNSVKLWNLAEFVDGVD